MRTPFKNSYGSYSVDAIAKHRLPPGLKVWPESIANLPWQSAHTLPPNRPYCCTDDDQSLQVTFDKCAPEVLLEPQSRNQPIVPSQQVEEVKGTELDPDTGLPIERCAAGFPIRPYRYRPVVYHGEEHEPPPCSTPGIVKPRPTFHGTVMDEADAPYYSDSD